MPPPRPQTLQPRDFLHARAARQAREERPTELPSSELEESAEREFRRQSPREVGPQPSVIPRQSRIGNRATEALVARLRANRDAALALDRAENQPPDAGAQQDSREETGENTGEVELDLATDDRTSSEEVNGDASVEDTTEPEPSSSEQAAETVTSTAVMLDNAPDPSSPALVSEAEPPAETPPSPSEAAARAESETEQVVDPPGGIENAAAESTAPNSPVTARGGGATQSAAPTGGGAIALEPGPEVAAWRAQVSADALAIETPELPTAGSAGAGVRQRGGTLRGNRDARREAISTEADAAVSDPPETEEPLPEPPPDPVPEANTLVENTANKTLTAVSLPDLEASPRGTQPLVPGAAPPPIAQEEAAATRTTDEGSSPAPSEGEPSERTESQLEEINAAAEAGPPEPTPGSAEGATITDQPPEPRQPLPPMLGNVMREVIARLLLNPGEQAEPIIRSARREAYPNGVLAEAYPDIGSERLSGLTDALSTALRAVADDAGIAAEDLDAAVENRRSEVEEAAAIANADIEAAQTEEREAAEDASADEVAEVGAAEDAQIAQTTAIVSAAQGEASPEVIERRARDQITKVNRQAGILKADYTRAKDRFHTSLDRAKLAQIRAYDAAAQTDRDALASDDTMTGTLQRGRVTNWLDRVKRELGNEVTRLKTAATNEANGFRGDTTAAALEASNMIRTWEENQKGEEMGFWERLWALFSDWSQQAEGEAEVWAEVRAGEARDATVGNMMVLNQFVQAQGETVDLETNAAFADLTEEQQQVVRAYYSSDPSNRDTIGAVASGLRHRLASQQKEPLIEALKSEVENKPYGEWPQLEQIGRAQRAGFSAEAISSQLYDAMFGGVTGWGTDEEQIYSNVTGLTPIQGKAVRGNYRADYGRSLDDDLESELDGDNALIRAKAALDGDPVMETVGALNEAMDGIGTDEDTIMRMLRGKTAEQRARIVEEYRRQYGVDLEAELDSEMDDHDQERAEALLAGDTARADAIALDQAMHGGILGWGTDEDQIESVYSDIRNDVAGEQVRDPQTGEMRPMTQAEMEAEVLRRNNAVEASYDERYGDPNDHESALRAAYNEELSGPDLDLANALADNDLVAADSARLERERQGFYTDDDVVNGILENQYARALDALERDPATARRRAAIRERAQREGWDSYQLADAERALQRELEERAQVGARENMAALEQHYDSNYSRWGSGGLQTMIAFNMSGTDQEKARTLLDQGGYLTPAQRIDYATRGLGTDEDEFEKAIAGRTEAEIAAINSDLADMGRGSVQQLIDEELDGREHHDMSIRARGVPQDADEEMRQAEMRVGWELDNSPVGGVQRDVMEARLARMRNQYRLINDPDADPQERRRALMQFQARGSGVEAGVESYRAQVDAVTDAVATAAALTAAIVVTVATGGVAGAVLGALAAAAMTMTVKAGLKGAAYGADEMAVDAVVGIVDAAAAYATFGMGSALLRVATSQGGRIGRLGGTRLASTLSRMAVSGSRAQRMLAHGAAELVEGAAGALPSALAGNVLNDKNWEQGNPLMNIVGGTLMETGMGGIMGGTMGSIGGISMPRVDPPTPRTGDILAHRGTPADRLSAWRAHRADNPDADMRSFLNQYDEQVRTRLAAESSDAAIQRTLRSELLSGIPPAQRGQFSDVPIEIMSDADFKAFTRSESGNAVTVIRNGEPRIIMRDGAPPGVLREEGLHLQQIADPDLGRLARRLDEGRLANWDSMPLGEQLELYAIKIDLEIDAQNKLIAGLRNDIAAAADPGQAARIQRQLDVAEANLANLTRRADEVGGLSVTDRLAMARGRRDPPPYLDQPPRLFSKGEAVSAKGADNAVDDAAADAADAVPARQEATGSRLEKADDFNSDTDTVYVLKEEDVPVSIDLPKGAEIETTQFIDGEWVDVTLRMKLGRLVDANGVTVPTDAVFRRRGNVPKFEITGRGKVSLTRKARRVEVVRIQDGVERRIKVEWETMAIRKKSLSEAPWGPRGGGTALKGDAGELASRMVGHKDPQVIASFDVQRGNKTGLDSVELVVDAEGVARLRLVEAKNYGDGEHVNFTDFSAILFNTGKVKGNLANNLEELANRLSIGRNVLRDIEERVGKDFPDLTPDEVRKLGPQGMLDRAARMEAAWAEELNAVMMAQLKVVSIADGVDVRDVIRLASEAFEAGRLQPLIRRARGTVIGNRGSNTAMPRLLRHWAGMKQRLRYLSGMLPDLIIPKNFDAFVAEVIPDGVLEKAQAAVKGLSDLRGKSLPDAQALYPTSVSGASFVTDTGDFVDVHRVASGDVASDSLDGFADGLVDRLRTQISTPTGSPADLHLVVDLSDLTINKAELANRLEAIMREKLGAEADSIMERMVFLRTRV